MNQFQESIICAIASLLLGDQVVVSEATKDEALSYFKDLLFKFIFRLEI